MAVLEAEQPRRRTVADRWTSTLAKDGHVQIARSFLRNYRRLNPPLTISEAMFVVHLFDYKWDRAAPWPKYKTLARHMGVTDKQVRRIAHALEKKRYLKREYRESRANLFHLDGLFGALERIVRLDQVRGVRSRPTPASAEVVREAVTSGGETPTPGKEVVPL